MNENSNEEKKKLLTRLKDRYLPDKPDDTKFKRMFKSLAFNAGLVLFVLITILLIGIFFLAL